MKTINLKLIYINLLILTLSISYVNGAVTFDTTTTYDVETYGKVAWHPANDWITFNPYNTTDVIIIDANSGETLHTLEPVTDEPDILGIHDFVWNEDGDFIAVGFRFRRTIEIWHYKNGEFDRIAEFKLGGENTGDILLAWSGDELIVIFHPPDNLNKQQAIIWDGQINEIDLHTSLDPYAIDSIESNSQGSYLAAYASFSNDIAPVNPTNIIIDPHDLSLVDSFPDEYELPPFGQPSWLDETTLSGISCNVSFDGCAIWLWNIENVNIETIFSDGGDLTISRREHMFALNQVNEIIAVVGMSDERAHIHLIDISSRTWLTSRSIQSEFVTSVAWNANNSKLAIATESVIHIIDIKHGV